MKRNFDNYADKSPSLKSRSRRAGNRFSGAQDLSIVKYGDSILEKLHAIKKFDAELEQLSEDMFASMYAAQGVGLAARKSA